MLKEIQMQKHCKSRIDNILKNVRFYYLDKIKK